MRKDHRDKARRLAHVLRRRMAENDRRHGRRTKIDPEVSRILANEADDPPESAIENPGVFTLREIAQQIGTTVGELVEEQVVGENDRRKLEEFAVFLVDRFGLFPELRNATAAEQRPIPIDETRFVERDYDYPRSHHAWLLRNASAAAGITGRESDAEAGVTEVLHSIRDVHNARMQVIRVIGDSMADLLRHDDKVLVDTERRSPREGEVVAVYMHTEGGVLGYWRPEGGDFWLDKENEAVPAIRLAAAGDWTLWGTVTRIVDKPVPRRRRSRR